MDLVSGIAEMAACITLSLNYITVPTQFTLEIRGGLHAIYPTVNYRKQRLPLPWGTHASANVEFGPKQSASIIH